MPDDPQTIDDSKKAAEALRFQHQCYLAANWMTFAKHNKGAKPGYRNFVALDASVSPTGLIEALAKVPGAEAFVNAPPVLLSSLVPQVRIYKIV